MCGRGRCSMRPDDFPRACHLNGRRVRHVDINRFRPSYNVSPGFNLPVIRRDDGAGAGGDGDGVVLQCMKWGLIPSFTKKTEKPDHYRMFNARSESLREKASFRRLIPNNRCLVSFEGFYEWKKDGSKKQPYYIYFRDGRPLVFAALYDSWKNEEGEVIYTFTIVTTSSSPTLEWLHDRMPVILSDKESTEMWLSGSPSSNFNSILKPYGESDLAWHPVTTAMGKPSFDGPECITEIHLKKDESKTISQFFSKKGVKSQQESEVETSTLKEESETEDDIKPDASDLHTGVLKVSEKREFAQLKDDDGEELGDSPVNKKGRGIDMMIANIKESSSITSSPAQPRKPGTSPGKKKAPVAGGKQQPTLFSYFGKS